MGDGCFLYASPKGDINSIVDFHRDTLRSEHCGQFFAPTVDEERIGLEWWQTHAARGISHRMASGVMGFVGVGKWVERDSLGFARRAFRGTMVKDRPEGASQHP
jgi:hypothetical protein